MSLFRNRPLITLTLGHFTLDLYSSVLPIMLPLLVTSLHLNYTQAGLVATVSYMSSSLTQPFFGYLDDRFRIRVLAPLGIIWSACFVVAAAYAGTYPILLTCVLLAALGSAAFHPPGTAHASLISGEHKASSLAIFALGGSLGFALGPLMGGLVFNSLGLRGAPLLLFPVLIILPLLWVKLSAKRGAPETALKGNKGVERAQLSWVAISSVALIVLLRPWAVWSLSTYLPLLYQSRGYSLSLASQVLFMFLLSGALGGLLSGFLTDKVGARAVLMGSLLLSTPFFYLFLHAPEPWPHLLVIPLGLFLAGLAPVVTFLVQSLLPGSLSSTASGFALGTQFSAGGLGAAITGVMADRIGLLSSLELLVFLPLILAIPALGVPTKEAHSKKNKGEISNGG